MGFYCTHYYSHTDQKNRRPLLPTSLKGIDYVVYNSFHELGRYTGITVHMGAVWASEATEVFDRAYKRQYGIHPKGLLGGQNPRFERIAPFHEVTICSPNTTSGKVGQQLVCHSLHFAFHPKSNLHWWLVLILIMAL